MKEDAWGKKVRLHAKNIVIIKSPTRSPILRHKPSSSLICVGSRSFPRRTLIPPRRLLDLVRLLSSLERQWQWQLRDVNGTFRNSPTATHGLRYQLGYPTQSRAGSMRHKSS